MAQQTNSEPVDVLAVKYGPIALARKEAIRRRAMKRWLRARGIAYPERATYDEAALRKLVRDNAALARAQGGAA